MTKLLDEWEDKNLVAMLKYLILMTVVAIGFMGVLVGRGLFADGSYFLLNILSSKVFLILTNRDFLSK